MATVRVELGERTQEQREAIMADLTEVMVKHGSPLESTQVILYEVSMDLWAKGGIPYSKRGAHAPAS
ncbi:MAG: 4-oxalocrotonate tautomerase [Microbacterium sp.]|nr:MAG: 4-oxalocrotonate tautomerase [Microbacterium sp.]